MRFLNRALARYRTTTARAGLAWRYFRRTMTAEDAYSLAYDCQEVAGDWALASFDLQSTIEEARERWEDHPELPRLCRDACERVASKWSGDDGNLRHAAMDWALDLVADHAKSEGIALTSCQEIAA